MLLTRIWAVILAILATGCLAGMFLLSLASGDGFTQADREAVRAVTEAGVVALEAQIRSSSVQHASSLLDEPAMSKAMARTPQQEAGLNEDDLSLSQVLVESAESLRVRTGADLTVAAVEQDGAVLAANGGAEPRVAELAGSLMFKNVPPDREALFSVALGSSLYAAKVSRALDSGRRLVAIDPLKIGGGSLLRRVLGSNTPAGIVQDGKLLGSIIGNQPVKPQLEAFGLAHQADAPDAGASRVFVGGEGLSARIGALGRVPGPAGAGPHGAMLVVLSPQTAAASQRDLAEALRQAKENGLFGRINWPLLIGLLLVSVGLAVYLPELEAIAPLRRLTREFEAMAVGSQHQIFYDQYGGAPGSVARAASAAHDALRQAYLAELEIEDDVEEATPPPRQQRPKTIRGKRLTRAHRKSRTGAHTQTDAPLATSAAATPKPTSADDLVSPSRAAVPPAHNATAEMAGPGDPTKTPALEEMAAVVPATSEPVDTSSDLVSAPTRRPEGATDPGTEPAAKAPPDPKEPYFREIYDEFIRLKTSCGESISGFTFARFAAKLRKNTNQLMEKRPGVKDVNFTVYIKDGKAALKAKVVKS